MVSMSPAPDAPQGQQAKSGGGGGGGRTFYSPMAARSTPADEDSSGPPIVSDAEQATLSVISTVQASVQASDRKIIRDATLAIETESPTEGLRQITGIA